MGVDVKKRIELIPHGWPCALEDLAPGLFLFHGTICLLNDYGDAFLINGGNAFWGGTDSHADIAKLIVQPMIVMEEEGGE